MTFNANHTYARSKSPGGAVKKSHKRTSAPNGGKTRRFGEKMSKTANFCRRKGQKFGYLAAKFFFFSAALKGGGGVKEFGSGASLCTSMMQISHGREYFAVSFAISDSLFNIVSDPFWEQLCRKYSIKIKSSLFGKRL